MTEIIKGASNLFNKMMESNSKKQFSHQSKVSKEIWDTSLSSTVKRTAQVAPMLTVKSNYARDRAVVINNGELVLVFDSEGIAKMPAHKREALQIEMTYRPGRYQIFEETVEKPVVEATPEPVIEETKTESVVETKSEEKQEEKATEVTKKITKTKVSKEK